MIPKRIKDIKADEWELDQSSKGVSLGWKERGVLEENFGTMG